MNSTNTHIAIVGAGPYGLAAAAHLRAAHVETVVFGRTMEFWKNNMPAGMLLRSPWDASHISGVDGLTLNDFYKEAGLQPSEPVSLERFINYGSWFQRHAAPDLDERRVVRIEKAGDRFRLHLEDGASLSAQRVVIATGIGSFAYRPEVFNNLPRELASHSAEHTDLKRFAGKSVVVVGRGQSALESAALLAEGGAEVELIARASNIRWLHAREVLRSPWNPLRRMFFHPTDVGPALFTQIAARPQWFKRIPEQWQPWFGYRCIRPAGAAWLRPRMSNVKFTTERSVATTRVSGGRLVITLDDGSSRSIDHALLATGYRIDIARHWFIAPDLMQAIRCAAGYPELGPGFESSIPGLHFLGAPAAVNFGPLMRFVSGTAYSGRELAAFVAAGYSRSRAASAASGAHHPAFSHKEV